MNLSNNAANNLTFDASNFVVNTESTAMPAGEWYNQYWLPYNNFVYYPFVQTQTLYLDKGIKALEISKMLQEKKLVNLRTAKQFAELMDAIIAVL